MSDAATFHEAGPFATRIRDLGLRIAGTWLEPVIAEFEKETQERGLQRLRPRFYLSNEWGVSDSLAIGIPFYLARPDLMALHAERIGHLEGATRADVLRYLRHELGHVVCYAYRLSDQEEWVRLFGANTQPYVEEYHVEPFSRRYVRHLPGWYAQKHPEEDWCETFAVWMTPESDWRADYAEWPAALAKLEYCDREIRRIGDMEPLATSTHQEDDVSELERSAEQFYRDFQSAEPDLLTLGKIELPPGLDGALKAVFEEHGDSPGEARRPASSLIRELERELMANVYRWTGHFPERTRALLRHLAERADRLGQVVAQDGERAAAIALTILVTTLAMNHVHKGTYLP